MNKAINLTAVVVMAAGLTVVAPLASTAVVPMNEQAVGAATAMTSSADTFSRPRPCRRWTWCAV